MTDRRIVIENDLLRVVAIAEQGPPGPQGAAGPSGAVLPPGVMMDYAGVSPPEGWLDCDGSELDREAYADLFAAIGTNWGSNSASSFTLPDFRGRVSVGAGTGAGLTGRSTGQAGGEEAHLLTESELAAHTHSYSFVGGAGTASVQYGTSFPRQTIASGSAGGDVPHNNMQPFAVAMKIIKV